MPDRSTENLERIRACDAGWNENDHPRANNGQFTSGGGGVKVSKATPDMKKGWHKYGNRQGFGKPAEEAAHNEKKAEIRAKSDDLTTRVAGEGNAKTAKERRRVLSAAKQTLEKARPRIAAMRELAKAAGGGAPEQSPTYKKSYSDAQAHLKKFEMLKPGTEEFNDSYAEAREKLRKWQGFLKKNPTDETSQRQVGWYQGLVDTYKSMADDNEKEFTRKLLKAKNESKAKLLKKLFAKP